jgi:hypothetical protein
VRNRIVELVLQHPRDVVLERIDGEPIAVAEPVQLEHVLQNRRDRHELVEDAVGNDERTPRAASSIAAE